MRQQILTSLLTVEIHNIDVVENIIKHRVESILNFEWQEQLRYYIDKDNQENNILIKQISTVIKYQFEYIGPCS